MQAKWFVPIFLAATALTGCSTGAAPAPPPPSTVTVSASPSAPPASSGTPDPSGAEDGGSGQGGEGGAAPVKGKCQLADVRPQVARTTGEAGSRHTTVTWTNVSSSTCTMSGFGGADLQGPAHAMGATYSLPRSSVQSKTVRLQPGDKAHTVITWLPGDWTPTKLLITPPDETHSAVLDWPGSGVLRQDGATHPGTYLGPVEAGAS